MLKLINKIFSMTDIQASIFKIVQQIPKGKVTNYGVIAKKLGLKSPRIVGWNLHRNDNSEKTPCHRVVFVDGSLTPGYAFGGKEVQHDKLMSEGVKFNGEKVSKESFWE